jgi:HlyD family secretion protein
MRKVEITKGISDGLRTEVLSGLEEGQVVVLPT